MRKSLLLFGMGLAAALTVQAQMTDSPWVGSVLPEEGGTYYLYNVESGLWLQHNRKEMDYWTTHAQLDQVGFDVVISPVENADDPTGKYWQVDPRFGHNHSLNALTNQGYMDTGDPVTPWTITPYNNVAGYTASNLYVFEALDGGVVLGPEIGSSDEDTYLTFFNDGFWQLVSKEERMNDLLKATAENPKDATWLVPGFDFANQDDRNAGWKNEFKGAGNNQINGRMYNCAVESWSNSVGSFYQDITGLPNGTYGLTVQGYYRDGSTNAIGPKHDNGTEVIRAYYFANEVSAPLMSICDNGVDDYIEGAFEDTYDDGYWYPGDGGKALGNAAQCFYMGYYWNEEIQVIVTNGTLRIGIKKDGGVGDDWTVFDNFHLTYYGNDMEVSTLLENLQKLIDEVNTYEGVTPQFLTDAYNAAVAALDSRDPEVIGNAMQELNNKYNVVLAAGTDMANFEATVEICQQELEKGGKNPYFNFATAIAEARQAYSDATTAEEFSSALHNLQIARKLYNAERGPRLWEGSEPVAEEKFYFYNIGQGRFLCGGDDWGAHAALGWPGIEILLETSEFDGNAFRLNTFLNNGGDLQYLNYGGYMDTAGDDWVFEPLGNGVFNIVRADSATLLLGYRPGTDVRVDTDMTGADNPDNQWVLVSRAERDAIAETATAAQPIDMSYRIGMPNFSQREDFDNSGWYIEPDDTGTHGMWGRGSNYPDFTYECWSKTFFEMRQDIYDLPNGWYYATVTGYYRDGDHYSNDIDGEHIPGHIEKFVNGEELDPAALFQVEAKELYETPLPLLTDYRDMAPGQGAVTEAGEVPQWVYQAVDYFQNNLYKVSLLVEVVDNTLSLIIHKDVEQYHDWVVVDNFRIIYLKDDPAGIRDVVGTEPVTVGKLYNLQGVEVAQPARGIYVRDGQKIIVK
ncbi:MAG: hypothetical protein IKH59_00455 [Bacteroidaceae bacterium]|nr:hypothetical protein [Bacteroidaceae bacterium]